jgi:uncharacterized protein (TIGR04255 family)
MKLPRKIDPDRIKDSILEVRFNSNLPYEIYLGQIYNSLDETYTYTNRPPIGQKNIQLPTDSSRELKLTFGAPVSLFFNDKIKFEIQQGSVIFNCVDKYITWEIYFPEVLKVLNQIFSSKCITSFNRVGVRYISEYPDTDIKSITKFDFSFGMPDILSDNYSFRSEYVKDNCRVILNLSSKIPSLNTDVVRKTISIIDIDVIKDNLEILDLESIVEIIDSCHNLEKVTFFKLLKEDFLLSLNPKY